MLPMVQGILKWIAEQVLEGKSLVNIDFGETGLNSGEKMALIDLALRYFPNPLLRSESEMVAERELHAVSPATPGPGFANLVTHPPIMKQDLFLPLEVKTRMEFRGMSRTKFRVNQRERGKTRWNSSVVFVAVRRGWKTSLTLVLQQ